MADLLEFAAADKTYSVWEVIEERTTALIARMYDVQVFFGKEAENEIKEIIEGWRKELATIRMAIIKANEKS